MVDASTYEKPVTEALMPSDIRDPSELESNEVETPKVPATSGNNSKAKPNEVTNTLQLCLLIACLFCGTFVMALDATIIGTAIPSITTEFNSLDDIAWYGSGYLLTITAFQPTFGKLYRFVNIKGVFMACVLIFEGRYTLWKRDSLDLD